MLYPRLDGCARCAVDLSHVCTGVRDRRSVACLRWLLLRSSWATCRINRAALRADTDSPRSSVHRTRTGSCGLHGGVAGVAVGKRIAQIASKRGVDRQRSRILGGTRQAVWLAVVQH